MKNDPTNIVSFEGYSLNFIVSTISETTNNIDSTAINKHTEVSIKIKRLILYLFNKVLTLRISPQADTM